MTIEPMEWRERAACRGRGNNDFYPSHENGGWVSDELKQLCAGCPVRTECGDWGLRHELYGWWGGLSEKKRRMIRKQRGIELDQLTPIKIATPEHGTTGLYVKHVRAGEKPCAQCRRAWADYMRRTRKPRITRKVAS